MKKKSKKLQQLQILLQNIFLTFYLLNHSIPRSAPVPIISPTSPPIIPPPTPPAITQAPITTSLIPPVSTPNTRKVAIVTAINRSILDLRKRSI